MSERLLIENFAGIKKVEIELNRLNILIGPQATGKSIVAKLFFFFKGFLKEIFITVDNQETKRELDKRLIGRFEDFFPSDSWGREEFRVRYELAEQFVEMTGAGGRRSRPSLTYSEYFNKMMASYRRRTTGRQSLIDGVIAEMGALALSDQLFIPAGRSYFANLQANVFSLLARGGSIDPFLREFGSSYEQIKRRREPLEYLLLEEEGMLHDRITQTIEKSLAGKFVTMRGEDYIEAPDGRIIHVANASSGQQELLPLAIILKDILFSWPELLTTEGENSLTVYIEEPEAHLFPATQRKVVELIAAVFNRSRRATCFLVTTHSPYILVVINNLIQAGLLYDKLKPSDRQKLQKIAPREYSLNPEQVAAYSLDERECKRIISSDTGLIDTNVIDAVSDDLAIQFDQLLDLE